jgi:chaperone BCS1
MHDMLMEWVASQPFTESSRSFLAQSFVISIFAMKWQMAHSDIAHYDRYLKTMAEKTKKKKQFKTTPSFGSHYFWYKGKILQFRRQKGTSYINEAGESEEISIHPFGRNPAILKSLLDECRQAFFKKDMYKTIMYKANLKVIGPIGSEPDLRCRDRFLLLS